MVLRGGQTCCHLVMEAGLQTPGTLFAVQQVSVCALVYLCMKRQKPNHGDAGHLPPLLTSCDVGHKLFYRTCPLHCLFCGCWMLFKHHHWQITFPRWRREVPGPCSQLALPAQHSEQVTVSLFWLDWGNWKPEKNKKNVQASTAQCHRAGGRAPQSQ